MVHIYGIPNCDTVKKAITWLKKHRIAFVFHDFKQETIPDQHLKAWCEALGWETVLNKKSTTWRALDAATQAGIKNNSSAIRLMKANMSIIKRPVLEKNGDIQVGFDEATYSNIFKTTV